jgi:hypothetical protein
MTSRPSTAAPILAVLAVALVALGAYVGGYFWLGQLCQSPITVTSWLNDESPELLRVYPHQWQALMFWPVARIETWVRGESVKTDSDSDL